MVDDPEYLNNLIDQGIEDSGEVEVEMAVLALCMRKNNAILQVVENKISEEDFSDIRNRTIFSVIIDMFLDNAQIDRITVYSELEQRGLADKAGGIAAWLKRGQYKKDFECSDCKFYRFYSYSDMLELFSALERA